MSDKALSRIERTLKQICGEIAALNARVDALAAQPANAASHDETIEFLDQFRAGESFGEALFGAWIEVSDVECVRGGLRVVQQREGMHGRLLEERIKQLGGACKAEIPESVADAAMKDISDRAKGDAKKVLDFVGRFGDVDKALKPIFDLADRLDHDPETQSLLRTIAQDERSTLEFMNDACAQLNG